MRQIISLVLIICLMTSFLFVAPSRGDSLGSSGSNEIFFSFMITGFLVIFSALILSSSLKANKLDASGWIEAINVIKEKYLHDSSMLHYSYKAKALIDIVVYKDPLSKTPIGRIYSGEEYYINEEKQIGQLLWYKIIIRPDHLVVNKPS